MANCRKELNVCCLSPLNGKYRTSRILNLDKKYRSHFEIIALLVEAVKDNSATRFSIMTHAGINCTQLKKYLQSLTQMGFIDGCINNGRVFYRASAKGLDFLRQYYVLLGILLSAHEQEELMNPIYQSEVNMLARQAYSQSQAVTHLQHPP